MTISTRTRRALVAGGGVPVNGQRVLVATMGNDSVRGGKAGSCTVDDQAVAVQLKDEDPGRGAPVRRCRRVLRRRALRCGPAP